MQTIFGTGVLEELNFKPEAHHFSGQNMLFPPPFNLRLPLLRLARGSRSTPPWMDVIPVKVLPGLERTSRPAPVLVKAPLAGVVLVIAPEIVAKSAVLKGLSST